jgi:hypothetical protein
MVRSCSIHGGNEKCTYNFISEVLNARYPLNDLGINGITLLKSKFEVIELIVWIGSISIMIWTSVGLL